MEMHWSLLVLCAIFLLVLSLVILLWWKSQQQLQLQSQTQSQDLISQLQKEKTDLLNRLMSSDLGAYSTTTALTNFSQTTTSDTYYAQSDEEELARIAAMSGLGIELHDDQEEIPEMQAMIDEMGLGNLGGK